MICRVKVHSLAWFSCITYKHIHIYTYISGTSLAVACCYFCATFNALLFVKLYFAVSFSIQLKIVYNKLSIGNWLIRCHFPCQAKLFFHITTNCSILNWNSVLMQWIWIFPSAFFGFFFFGQVRKLIEQFSMFCFISFNFFLDFILNSPVSIHLTSKWLVCNRSKNKSIKMQEKETQIESIIHNQLYQSFWVIDSAFFIVVIVVPRPLSIPLRPCVLSAQ